MGRKIKITADGGVEIHHYDGGGVVGGGGAGGVLPAISGALTTQNTYNASGPDMGNVVKQQNDLAGILRNEAMGGGPNPAQLQFQQNAQQLAQQQAAMTAQNRALNPGLAARMSAEQAAAMGGQAAGTAAAQQAQQQLAAQGQFAGLTGQEQTGALGAEGINAQVSQNNANAVNNTSGGLLNGLGSAVSSFLAKGGEVGKDGITTKENPKVAEVPKRERFMMPAHMKEMADIYHPKKFASGGVFNPMGGSIQVAGVPNFSNAPSMYKTHFAPGSATPSTSALPTTDIDSGTGATDLAPSAADALMVASKGGKVPALVSPGERYVPPSKTKAVADGQESVMRAGEKVPGKAKVIGDSEKNDFVPAKLEEGGVVIPRSVLQSDDPEKAAAKFVAEHLRKNGGGKKDHDDFKGALKRAVSERKNK